MKYMMLENHTVKDNVQSHKFYEMVENEETITVTYGRCGKKGTLISYPKSDWDWDKLLSSKLKKGYVEVE